MEFVQRSFLWTLLMARTLISAKPVDVYPYLLFRDTDLTTNIIVNKKLRASCILGFVVVCIIIMVTTCSSNDIVVNGSSTASTVPANNPCVKVFIENSGSMDGYMCDGSQLKDAVYDYVSDLNRNTDTTELYYINSNIIPYKGNLTSYIKDLNPETFHKAGGNTAITDLGNIIATVLNTVNDTTIAIFISDCILDLPAKNAQKFLTNCEIRIKDEIINARKRTPDLGVEILKLSSDFEGTYFYPSGESETLKEVKRPYYIWIFGNKNYLAKLNTKVPLSMLAKYDLSGIVAFANQTAIPFDIFNNALTGKTVKPSRGEYHITILADFRNTIQPDGCIQDKKNYSFNNAGITIEGIYPISNKTSNYTHFIKFKIPKGVKVTQESLKFDMPGMPSWVSESNDETGTNILKNISKTTGIKYLIQGVADAFSDEKVSAELKFSVQHK